MSVLKRNILFNLVGQTFVILLGFVSFKFIYQDLGEDALGIIYFSLMFSGLITSSLDLGLTKTTTREVAGHYQDSEYIKRLTQTFFLFYWLAYMGVISLFVLLLPIIVEGWINLSTMKSELAQYVLLILGITSLLAIPKMLMASILVGLQRMDINNTIEVFGAVVQQLGMVFLLMNGYGIKIIVYWISFINILKFLSYTTFIVKLLSLEAILPKYSREVVERVKAYTGKMMLVSSLLVIHKQFDKVVVSKLLPIGTMGIYSFAYTSISKTSLITGAVAQAVFPSFSESVRRGELTQSLKRYFTLQDLLVFGTIPIFAFAALFAPHIFRFLLDDAKAAVLQIPVLLLCLYFYLNAVMRLVRTYIFAKGKPESAIRADVISLVTVTPLTVILVYYWGISGAALSSVLYYVVMAATIIPSVYLCEFNQPPIKWFKSVVTAMVLGGLVYGPVGYFVYSSSFDIILYLLSLYLFATLVYGLLAVNMVGSGLQKIIINYLPITRQLIVLRKI